MSAVVVERSAQLRLQGATGCDEAASAAEK